MGMRAARAQDIPTLESFIAAQAADGLLPRARQDIRRCLSQFLLAVHGERIIGCGALQPVDQTVAEIRSVAVDPSWRGKRVGLRIVQALVRRARMRGFGRLFCLTRREAFFGRVGFHPVPRDAYPHKLQTDCLPCPRRLSCDEVAMERRLTRGSELRLQAELHRHRVGDVLGDVAEDDLDLVLLTRVQLPGLAAGARADEVSLPVIQSGGE